MAEYPLIDIGVVIGSQTYFGEALPDTGYDGAVIIPADTAIDVERPGEQSTLRVADGHVLTVEKWDGQIHIANRCVNEEVRAFGDLWIVGRKVLDQFEVCFHFGKEVRIRSAE